MKTQTRSSGRRAPHSRHRLIIVLAVVVLVMGLGFWLWAAPARVEAGTPRLETDRTEIDVGDVRFERWVTAAFTLRNAGDGTLTIDGAGPARATEGC